MFQNNRYLTRGVGEKIPLELQLLMWNALEVIPEPKDYFQVFRLSVLNGIQRIEHGKHKIKYVFHKKENRCIIKVKEVHRQN